MRRLLLAVLLVAMTGCGPDTKPEDQPAASVPSGIRPSAADRSKSDGGPVIEIRSHQELDFEPGIKLTAWTLRSSRVQELTARLLFIKDGKSEVAQELVCKWDKWPESKPEAEWHLYYLLQDGEPFGAKNKRLPAITLQFDDATPSSTATERSTQFLQGEFRRQTHLAWENSTLDPSRAEVIYYGFYDPAKGDPAKGDTSVTLRGTVEALVEASKGGRTVVAIVVEWKPVGGGK
jgi:hypothetical protein